MYRPSYTKQFKKDMERSIRQGRDVEQFKLIASILVAGQPLDPLFGDHKLIGSYKGRRECHIESDWLLIYKIANDSLVFERIGSHSELFQK